MLAYLGPLLVCLLGKVIYSLGNCYPIIPKIPFIRRYFLVFYLTSLSPLKWFVLELRVLPGIFRLTVDEDACWECVCVCEHL